MRPGGVRRTRSCGNTLGQNHVISRDIAAGCLRNLDCQFQARLALAVHNLADCVEGLLDARGEVRDLLAGRVQMIDQLHRSYVPHQGTLSNQKMCPTGVLALRALRGHSAAMLPNNIATYRKRAGLSQERLAKSIGTTKNMLIKLEKGTRGLTSDWLEKIGRQLEVPPYLLIAPEHLLPTEEQLADMLSAAQSTLPAGLPYSEWPRAVAAGLHTRLRTLSGDLASAGDGDARD